MKLNMTYENYDNPPLQAIQMRLNMIVAKTPHLIDS